MSHLPSTPVPSHAACLAFVVFATPIFVCFAHAGLFRDAAALRDKQKV